MQTRAETRGMPHAPSLEAAYSEDIVSASLLFRLQDKIQQPRMGLRKKLGQHGASCFWMQKRHSKLFLAEALAETLCQACLWIQWLLKGLQRFEEVLASAAFEGCSLGKKII